jgi:hypothetical protein
MTIQEFLDFYKISVKKELRAYTKEEITALALIMYNHTPNGLRTKINEIEKAFKNVEDPFLVYTFFNLN